MAEIKVSQLPEAIVTSNNDLLMIVQNNTNKKIPLGRTGFAKKIVYDTTEVDTGNKWIDGKIIYRKVIDSTTGSTTNVWTSLGLTGVDTIINYHGELIASSTETYLIPFAGEGRYIWFRITNGSLEEAHNIDFFSSKPFKIVFEYTKTTD